jgi:phospholipid transport system substrate-binding protein
LALAIAATASAGAMLSPQALVSQTADRMMDKLRAEKETLRQQPDRVYELVNEIVLPNFDFEIMAKRVLGKNWRDASPKQREDFVVAFRGVLVRTYANRLTEYTDYKINYLPSPPEPEPDRAVVRSEVDQPGRTPIQIDYRLTLQGDAWKVYDVIIEGVSLVTNYRSSFNNEIAQGGIDKLIARLNDTGKVE